jgi:hypothetical protein
MNKKVIHFQKALSVNKFIILSFLLLNTTFCFSQKKLVGTYSLNYKLKDFYTNYIFLKKGIFTYESGGDVAVIDFGKGHYLIKNDSLILNYDLTELKEKSYHQQKSYKNFKDSVLVKINIYDVDKNTLSGIVVKNDVDDLRNKSNKNGVIVFNFKNKKGKVNFRVLDWHFRFEVYEFSLYSNLNHEVNVYLRRRNGIGVKNIIYKYKILEINKKYIKLENKNGIAVIWKKRVIDNN